MGPSPTSPTAHGRETTSLDVPLEHLAALGRLVRVINRDSDLDAAMRAALAAVLEILDFDGGGIYVVDAATRTARVRCSSGLPEDFVDEVGVVEIDAAPYAPVLDRGEALYLDDYAAFSAERAARWSFQAMASIPLPCDGTVFGALNVVSTRRRRFTVYERSMMEAVGEELGIAFSRAQAVDALRRAEDDLRSFFELCPDMLFVLDGDGDVIDMNQEASRQLGYSPEEFRGRSVFDLHPAEHRDKVANTVTRMLSGLENACYVPLVTSEGHEIPVETRISHGRWNASDALFGICRNSRTDRVLGAAVEALTSALELRDAYTAGHTRDVARVSEALAKELGMSPDRVELVSIAARLHDIGKLAIPGDILSKTTPLSKGEVLVIQEHAQAGYDLLRPMEFLGPIPQIVRQHHERLDGSGYPDGLTGENILLEARIIAVADVVEAMSAHRPYRAARPIRAALNEIADGAGTKYDRDVARALRSLWKKGELPLKAAQAGAKRRRRPRQPPSESAVSPS